jgi:two-component system KDP operon response regulator KdpE
VTDVPIVVLVIEDEPQMQKFLGAALGSEGYRVLAAPTGEEGIALARSHHPDVILLDLGLPDLDGVDVTRRIREHSSRPILVISARGREDDKIRALDAGADDYLTKPFGTGELMARLRVALRHASRAVEERVEPVLRAFDIEVDLDKRRVTKGGAEVHLTPNEYKLLAYLLKNAGKVLTHRQLLKEVWGAAYASQTHYVRVYMVQLRHKLESDPARPRFLLTEAGVGYRLRTDD